MSKKDLLEGCKFADPCEPEKPVEKWDVYAEKKFCPKIKVHNWWYHRESQPKDHDDVVRASYDRLGNLPEDADHWTSETAKAMREGRGDPNLSALQNTVKPLHLLTFLSYPTTLKTRKDLLPEEIRKILPSLPRDLLTLRYTTTNQAHYKKKMKWRFPGCADRGGLPGKSPPATTVFGVPSAFPNWF